ncbi:hypothetical protein pb186bvf_007685 [Paramecium bursaria]
MLFLLYSISVLTSLLGYFMSSQPIEQYKSTKNPVFEEKDWFIHQFDKLILIVKEDFIDGYSIKYHINFQYNMEYATIFNTIMKGISPLAQLQYWNVQYKNIDSIINQLKTGVYAQTASDYTYLDKYTKTNFQELVQFQEFIYDQDIKFYYIDEISLTDQLIKQLIGDDRNNETLYMVLSNNLLHVYSKLEWYEKPDNTIYELEQLTATISSILNIPIPIQNHGIMLPGFIFKSKQMKGKTSQQIQIKNYLENQDQLYQLLTAIDNPYQTQQQQKLHDLTTRFTEYLEDPQPQVGQEILDQSIKKSYEIIDLLNSQISGNRLIIFVGFIFQLVCALNTLDGEITKQDQFYLIILCLLSISGGFLETIILFIALCYIEKNKDLFNIVKIVLIYLYFASSPFHQFLISILMIPLVYREFEFLKGIQGQISTQKQGFYVILLLIYLALSRLGYFFKLLFFILTFIRLYRWQRSYNLLFYMLLLNIDTFDSIYNIVPYILLCTIHGNSKENLIQNPIQLISILVFINVTWPTLPQDPLIQQILPYFRILSIVFIIQLQKFFEIMNQIKKQQINLNLQELFISLFESEIVVNKKWINILLMVSSIFASFFMTLNEIIKYNTNLEYIGNQYFLFQVQIQYIFVIMIFNFQPDEQKVQEIQNDVMDDMKEIEL